MAFRRRIAVAISLLSVGLVALVASSAAVDAHVILKGGGGGGGNGLPAAGNYSNKSVNASMCCGGLTVSVLHSTNTADPLVGPSTFTDEIDVSFNICDFVNGVCGNGCFVVAPSDFSLAGDLSSATLTTTFNGTQPQCSLPFSGPPVSFQPPLPQQPNFTLTATWTNSGPVGSFKTVGRYMCGAYTSETSSLGSSAFQGTATTQISLEPATTFGPFGGFFGTFNQTIHVQGTPGQTCGQLGGKGAGAGPQPPGNYQFTFQQASFSLPPSATLPVPLTVSVISVTNVSNPRGAGSTTQSETDINISEPFFPPTIGGCFALAPGAFAVSSSGASLHALIDQDGATKQCPFSQPPVGLPDEFSVDVTWTADGALASLRSESTFTCGQLINVGSSLETSVNATASGQLSGVTDPFAGLPSNIFTNASIAHVLTQFPC